MNKLKQFFNWCLTPYTNYKEKQKLKKRIEELKKRDPFIYK